MLARKLIIAVALLMGGSSVGCLTTPPPPAAADVAAAAIGDPPKEDVARLFVQEYVKSRLKDPDSARFRWGTISRDAYLTYYPDRYHIGWVLNVGVNARNGFGGYGGEQLWMFAFRDGAVVAIGEPYEHGSGTTPPTPAELPYPVALPASLATAPGSESTPAKQ